MTQIRPAREGEGEVLRAIARAAYEPYVERIGTEPWPMLEDYGALVAAGEVWVAENEGVVGYVVLKEQPDHLLLDNVAVSPERQGTGVGRRLMAYAEEHARENGFEEIRLYTNEAMTENLALYPRLGYVETGRETFQVWRRVLFSKRL